MNCTTIKGHTGDFHILQTTSLTQTAVIRLNTGESTSESPNSHPESEQTLLLLEGTLHAEVGDDERQLSAGAVVIIPAGTKHRFTNRGDAPALAFTTYTPPAYPE